jgi:Xaa-Pro dipeptidase
MAAGNSKLKRVLEFINRKGLNGLIVYSNGAANILRPNHLHWFSGCRPMGPRNAAVVSKSGDVRLLVTPKWDQARVSSKSWIKDVRGTSAFVDELVSAMRQLRLTGPVGLAGSDEMNAEVYDGIRNAAEIIRADEITPALARPKTEAEIENARKAGRAADAGYKAFIENARPGITEYEFLAEMELAMRAAGADDNFNLMSSGKHNHAMHAPTDRRLAVGDIIIGEISPVVDGQVLQICRTVVLGNAAPVLVEKYAMLVHALAESLKAVRPGNPASAMAVAMNKVLIDAGYARYCAPPYMRARGHGMGLGSVAPGGVIDDETATPFEKGQVVVVHPNQYLPETGYLACGETVLITDTGYERLEESLTTLCVKEVYPWKRFNRY